MLTGTISEPAGSPATAVSYDFEYGTTTAYGSTTPSSAATATPAGVSWSASPLERTGALHDLPLPPGRERLRGCELPDRVALIKTFTTGSTLPADGITATVGATTTAGHVLVELHGKHHFVSLTAGELVPLGAMIDARHGTVLIQSAIAPSPGEVASGLFSGGEVRRHAAGGGDRDGAGARRAAFIAGVVEHKPLAHRGEKRPPRKKKAEVEEGRKPGLRQRPRPVLDARVTTRRLRIRGRGGGRRTAATAR